MNLTKRAEEFAHQEQCYNNYSTHSVCSRVQIWLKLQCNFVSCLQLFEAMH